MAHTELDLRERRAIEDMLNAKMPVSKIAVEIGRAAVRGGTLTGSSLTRRAVVIVPGHEAILSSLVLREGRDGRHENKDQNHDDGKNLGAETHNSIHS